MTIASLKNEYGVECNDSDSTCLYASMRFDLHLRAEDLHFLVSLRKIKAKFFQGLIYCALSYPNLTMQTLSKRVKFGIRLFSAEL